MGRADPAPAAAPGGPSGLGRPSESDERNDAAHCATIGVHVVCALAPHQWLQASLRLPAGATALQALKASGLIDQLPPGLLDHLVLGLWGRACPAETALHDGDRVELTRPLEVDPKEARRLRYRRDGLPRKKSLRR
jgi:putative ubiquitin-RnfH superfamily antitoxin RatB of RatAB toxin-antitoxin module